MHRCLYSHPVASVRTICHISQSFTLGRGSRQGCPLSLSLFALAIEPLAIAIHNSSLIRGLLVGNGEEHV